MSPRALFRLARVYLLVLLAACFALSWWLGVPHAARKPLFSIVSVWQGGIRGARAVVEQNAENALRPKRFQRVVIEDVVATGPVLSTRWLLFGSAFVPGRDGIEAHYRGRVAYATIDDLVKLGAYDSWVPFGTSKLCLSIDPEAVVAFLGRELHATPEELRTEGTFRRLVIRHRPERERPEVTKETLRAAALAAGSYLARAVRPDGSYRYETDAATGADTPEYNWPRHAGATWYLSDVAAYSKDPWLTSAALRAGGHLVSHALVDCGTHRCIAGNDRADLGSSALALLAFVELYETGRAPGLAGPIADLSAFLRSMQRPDGEFMHLYDRRAKAPIDVQLLYYTGEATLALARAERVTRDGKNLEAARRALASLVDMPAWYVGWRYFFGAEHWTCHAMNELWDRAPNPKALRFCLAWQESVRNLAIEDWDAGPELDGATSAGPLVLPALVGSSSRMEAAVSTLEAARKAGVSARESAALEAGIRQTLAFMMRFQFTPGPDYLMPAPAVMFGGFPSTPVDLKVRIDFPQHAGTALLHYLRLLERHG